MCVGIRLNSLTEDSCCRLAKRTAHKWRGLNGLRIMHASCVELTPCPQFAKAKSFEPAPGPLVQTPDFFQACQPNGCLHSGKESRLGPNMAMSSHECYISATFRGFGLRACQDECIYLTLEIGQSRFMFWYSLGRMPIVNKHSFHAACRTGDLGQFLTYNSASSRNSTKPPLVCLARA